MDTIITARHFELTDEIRAHVEAEMRRLNERSHKFHSAHVILEVEPHGNRQTAEIVIHANTSQYLAKSESHDMYISIDEAIEKLKRQLDKYREKITDHHHHRGHRVENPEPLYPPDSFGIDDEDSEPEIIEVDYNLKPMSVEEAALQLKMTPQNLFLVFLNARTGRTNVLYRRKDGSFGLIQPLRRH